MTVRDILLEMDAILLLMLQTKDGWEQLEMLDSVIEKAEGIEDQLEEGPLMVSSMKSEREKLHAALTKAMN